MKKSEIQPFITDLNLPADEFVIFGGASLAIRGIRNCGDIDLFVTPSLENKLAIRGWEKRSIEDRPPYLVTMFQKVAIQAFSVWVGGQWQPDITGYIEKPELVEELPFMPLNELYKWKEATRRPKDLHDLNLINEWFRAQE